MKCSNCGYKNIKDALYCRKCGAKLKEMTELSHRKRLKWTFGSIGAIVIIALIVVTIIVHGRKMPEPVEEQSKNTTVSTEAAITEKEIAPDETGIHRYSYELADCGWKEASERAKEAGGYLVHINSQEEFLYITEELEQQGYHKMQFYIGGRRPPEDNSYYWVDENNRTYGDRLNDNMGRWFWMEGEPSFTCDGDEETYLNMFYYRSEGRWVGNDTTENAIVQDSNFKGHVGYIVEYED